MHIDMPRPDPIVWAYWDELLDIRNEDERLGVERAEENI